MAKLGRRRTALIATTRKGNARVLIHVSKTIGQIPATESRNTSC